MTGMDFVDVAERLSGGIVTGRIVISVIKFIIAAYEYIFNYGYSFLS